MALVRELVRQGALRPAARRLGARHRRRPARRRRRRQRGRGELRRLRAGSRPRARLPPRGRVRHDRDPRDLLLHAAAAAARGRVRACRSCRCAASRARGSSSCTRSTARSTCPFTGERLVAVPALAPDVALIHGLQRRPPRQRPPAPPARARRALRPRVQARDRHRRAARRRRRGGRRRRRAAVVPRRRRRRGAARRPPDVLLSALRLRPRAPARVGRRRRAATRASRDYLARYVTAAARRPTSTPSAASGWPAWPAGRSRPSAGWSWRPRERRRVHDRRVGLRRAGAHDPRRRDRLPRLRQPVRAGRDVRRQAHARAADGARRGLDLRASIPSRRSSRRRPTTAALLRRAVAHPALRGAVRPRARAAAWTGCSCPAGRSTRTATRTSPRSAGCRGRRSSSAGAAAAATCRRPSASSRCGRPATAPAGRSSSTCDFITDLGHRTPLGTRAELGMPGGGPATLVSELGVLRLPRRRGCACASVFPDVDARGDRSPPPASSCTWPTTCAPSRRRAPRSSPSCGPSTGSACAAREFDAARARAALRAGRRDRLACPCCT